MSLSKRNIRKTGELPEAAAGDLVYVSKSLMSEDILDRNSMSTKVNKAALPLSRLLDQRQPVEKMISNLLPHSNLVAGV
jgi:hypothetical protein